MKAVCTVLMELVALDFFFLKSRIRFVYLVATKQAPIKMHVFFSYQQQSDISAWKCLGQTIAYNHAYKWPLHRTVATSSCQSESPLCMFLWIQSNLDPDHT